MFDSLADRMKQDERKESSTMERTIRIVVTLVIAIVVFGGIYIGIRLLE